MLREMVDDAPPLPGGGRTPERHRFLFELGRRDLSLARLAEAHWDAVAILAEAGRTPVQGAVYGVWAAEVPGQPLSLKEGMISGMKPFCSGAGLIDRALVTVGEPEHRLVEVDLRKEGISFDASRWHTQAFAETKTATAMFSGVMAAEEDFVGEVGFYLSRPGFWHGACGPAACWAGGAAGLVDWAKRQGRRDPHTLAHLGAMRASQWAMECVLEAAGREIDESAAQVDGAQGRALTLRHLVEMHSTDILRRLVRAYGPHPMAMDEDVARRYQELDLYLRQSHAERDLEVIGAWERDKA